jgi:hypothetical protein
MDFMIEPLENHMLPPLSMRPHHNRSSISNSPNHTSDLNSINKILNTIKLLIKCINPTPIFKLTIIYKHKYRYDKLTSMVDALFGTELALSADLHSLQQIRGYGRKG